MRTKGSLRFKSPVTQTPSSVTKSKGLEDSSAKMQRVLRLLDSASWRTIQ